MISENFTTLPIPLQYSEPNGLRYFRLFLFGLITVGSLLGNTIVVRSITSIAYRKPFTYHMVTCLATAELVSSLLLPFILIYEEAQTWPFGETMCHLVSPGQITAGLVVTWSLAIISIHRYRSLANYQQFVFGRFQNWVIGLMWASATLITFPSYLYSTLVKSPYDNVKYWCLVMFEGDTLKTFPSQSYMTYLLFRFAVTYIIPVLTMLTSYGSIGLKLKYHMSANHCCESQQTVHTSVSGFELAAVNKTETSRPGDDVTGTENPGQPMEVHDGGVPRGSSQDDGSPLARGKVLIELEQDLLRMIYVIVLIFIVCYFPYQLFFLLEYFQVLSFTNWKYFEVTRKFIFLTTCFPSALHPLCYGTMSKFYGKAFSAIILCKKDRRVTQLA
ncbi:cholecystokinin receptor [Nematostella vectensis]|uniref:cholecystokinin receptor n=1 Tax=Nematostella vectensis TaxID=45351 RepID=UPI0020779042|nr:cholecystokinin receptor [Nematostella vectensis]XP_032220455.2 cholecystokinin receptor [Nematostella vectensis]